MTPSQTEFNLRMLQTETDRWGPELWGGVYWPSAGISNGHQCKMCHMLITPFLSWNTKISLNSLENQIKQMLKTGGGEDRSGEVGGGVKWKCWSRDEIKLGQWKWTDSQSHDHCVILLNQLPWKNKWTRVLMNVVGCQVCLVGDWLWKVIQGKQFMQHLASDTSMTTESKFDCFMSISTDLYHLSIY